jgi:hypothetical protein
MSPSRTQSAPAAAEAAGTARSFASTGSRTLSVSAGASRRKRQTGSQTTVPARRSAAMTTSGVSLRKSCGVLSGPRVAGGPSGCSRT